MDLVPDAQASDEETRARVLRVDLQAAIDRDGLSVRTVAEQAAVGYSTLNAWMKDAYAGRVDSINVKVEAWLNAQRSRDKVRTSSAKTPGFLDIPTAGTLLSVLEYAQFTPDMGLITGGAGVGKTEAALEHQRRNPNVWILTADPDMKTPNAVLRELCDVIGVENVNSRRMMSSIIRRVTDTQGLVVIDEAQHLKTDAIDQLRSVHDRARIGVVFMGNEPLRKRIEGMGREASHAMIFSRIGMRKKRDRPQVKDVAMLLDAWGISEKTIRDLCRFIAMQPGGLRQMNKTISYARMLATSAGRAEMSVSDVKAAWRELTNGELPVSAGE
ncbi:AAA family ATPase [Acetobacter fallax]|nr:AAA family ATPase [Acetobacter fallax]